jgi:hypothetical protein
MATRPKFARMANVSRRDTFFSKKPFGECRQMYRVRPKQVGECRRMYRVLAKPRQMLAHDKIGRFKHK